MLESVGISECVGICVFELDQSVLEVCRELLEFQITLSSMRKYANKWC